MAILQGWAFCSQILWICDVPCLQVVRPLIPFGVVSVVLNRRSSTLSGSDPPP